MSEDKPSTTRNPDGSMTVHLYDNDRYIPPPLPEKKCSECCRPIPTRENPYDLGNKYSTIEKKRAHGERIDGYQRAYLAGDVDLDRLSWWIGVKPTPDFREAAGTQGELKKWYWRIYGLNGVVE